MLGDLCCWVMLQKVIQKSKVTEWLVDVARPVFAYMIHNTSQEVRPAIAGCSMHVRFAPGSGEFSCPSARGNLCRGYRAAQAAQQILVLLDSFGRCCSVCSPPLIDYSCILAYY